METLEQPQTTRTTMQHRSYQPLLPAVNKYLQQKWDKASYDLHRQKVKSVKPVINTSAPKTFGHLALKLKKQKLEEDWKMKIEKENNMLMEKIAHIMRTTGGVENKNNYDRKSLSMNKRQQELLRITKENEMILFRLSQCRSHYNVKCWHEDWLKTLKMMDSITRYPQDKYQGQENLKGVNNGCKQEQKIICDTSNKTNSKGKFENNERKCDSETETAPEVTQDATPPACPNVLNVPAEPTASVKPKNHNFSDTVEIEMKENLHFDQTSLDPNGSEMSNITDTSKTNKQETTSTEED